MKQKSVGMTLRAVIIALALILVAGSPALPPFDGVAYAQAGLSAVVAPDGDSVILSWGAISDADSYEVWKGDGRGSSVDWGTSALASVTTPSYTDEAVTAGATYSYAIRPVDDGTAGTWSNVESVTIPGGTTAPTGTPTVSVAADGLTAVDVSWTSVSGATQYHIQFWHAALGNDWERISGNQTSPYNHTGRNPGTEYFYVVRAVNAGGNGKWSNWRTDNSKITLQSTTTVPKLTLTHVSRTTVRLTWTPTTGAAEYDLQRKKVVAGTGSDASTDYARLPSSLLSGLSHTDSAAEFDVENADETTTVTYHYRVQAIDSNGVAGDWSSEKTVSIPASGVRLVAPATFAASAASHTSIRVTWDARDGADYYQLQSKSGTGSYSSPIRVESNSYNHTNLSPLTKYTYQVRAVNINGPSDWTAERSATTRSTPTSTGQMPMVTGLTVTDESTAADGPKVKLTWNAVSGATHYEIQRFNPADGTPAWANPADGGGLASGLITVEDNDKPTTYEDITEALAEGQTYYYVVSAVDQGPDDNVSVEADNDLGEWSDYKSVTLDDIAPGPPTNLEGTVTGEASIWVSWTAPAVDRTGQDPTGEATSYTLQWRREGQTASWNSITVTGRATHHHTGLNANTPYYYRVRAINSGGMSDYTSELSRRTLPQVLSPPPGLDAEDATVDTTYGIKVSWDAVTGASNYEIQRFGAGTNDNEWGSLTDAAGDDTDEPDTDVTDANALEADTTYFYRVRSVSTNGDVKSKWSAVVSGTTKAAMPEPPTLVAITTGQSMIRLSWEAVSAATNYELELLEGSHADTVFNNALIQRTEMTLAGTLSHYVHTNLKAGTRYSYRLRGTLPLDVASGWSTIVMQYTKPAPADLSASAAISTTMTLTWDAVSFVAADGTAGRLTDNANYQIERRESGSGDWTSVTVTGDVCVTETNKCTLTDNNGGDSLTAGTHYYFRIRATVTRDGTAYTSYWDYTNQRTPAN